jgi:hypothetical protein
MSKKILRERMDIIVQEGFTILDTQQAKHFKVRAAYRGREHTIVFPVSPSDHRSLVKFRGDLSRLKRSIDMELA